MGPQFCNSSLHFNRTELDPIKDQLQQYWIDIHNGSTYSLWNHEWKKHGTCATALPALDREDKYFRQGLNWIKQYDMKNILSQSGIEPNDQGYFPQDVWNAVQKSLGKNPTVQCHNDPVSVIIILIYKFTQSAPNQCTLLYVFFWVLPRRLNFICRRFGTLCLFHLHRQVGVE